MTATLGSERVRVSRGRHQRWKLVTIPLVFALATVNFATNESGASGGRSPDHAHLKHQGTLTNTSLGGYTQIDQIDMLSPTMGYALATHPFGAGHFAFYLVRTTDLARTWTLQSRRIFVQNYPPRFSDEFEAESDPPMDFVSPEVGYVAGPNNVIYMTTNAGGSWSRLSLSGSYGITSEGVTVVSSLCTHSGTTSESCVNTISEFPLGSTVPEHSSRIPNPPSHSLQTALLAAGPGSTDVVNLSSDALSSGTSLLVTKNGGDTWQPLANPCAGQLIEQLSVSPTGDWLLSCIHDEGMSQGPARVFLSSNEGTSWRTVLNELHGTTLYYYFGENARTIFAASTNPAGGLGISTNGGRTWSDLESLGNTGGAPESVSVLGPTSALYQVYQGPIYVTRNDRTWTLVPPLPAGEYHGVPICTSDDTTVHLHRVTSGGLHYGYLDFTNEAHSSCYLYGVPQLQPLNSSGHAVGPVITTDINSSDGDFLVLSANGGPVNVDFQANQGYNSNSHCDARRASAVRIEFAPSSVFRLSLPSRTLVCTTFQSIFANQVAAGRGHP